MTLPLEFGSIRDPAVQRALQVIAQQFPVVATGGGGGGAPSGPAGGVLAGVYPNPSFSADMATQAELDAHAIDTTAVHGITDTSLLVVTSDTRLSDSRAPNGAAGGDLSGTYPDPQIGTGVIVNADVNAAAAIAESKLSLATDAAAGTGSRRTLGTGATQAAAGNDARFTDARTPTAHQSTHQSGSTDPLTGNLDATARSNVSKAGTLVGTRRGLNLIQGTNVTLTMADNPGSERVDVTIDAVAGGGGTADTFVTRAKWMTD